MSPPSDDMPLPSDDMPPPSGIPPLSDGARDRQYCRVCHVRRDNSKYHFREEANIPITPGCTDPDANLSWTCQRCVNIILNAPQSLAMSRRGVGRPRIHDAESQLPSPRPHVRGRRDSDPQPLRRSNRIRSRERSHSMDLTVHQTQQISSRRRGRDPSAVVPRKERRVSTETKASTTSDNDPLVDQQFIGLINYGFTCYLNVISILLVTIPFYRDLIISFQFNEERLQTNAMAVLQQIINLWFLHLKVQYQQLH